MIFRFRTFLELPTSSNLTIALTGSLIIENFKVVVSSRILTFYKIEKTIKLDDFHDLSLAITSLIELIDRKHHPIASRPPNGLPFDSEPTKVCLAAREKKICFVGK